MSSFDMFVIFPSITKTHHKKHLYRKQRRNRFRGLSQIIFKYLINGRSHTIDKETVYSRKTMDKSNFLKVSAVLELFYRVQKTCRFYLFCPIAKGNCNARINQHESSNWSFKISNDHFKFLKEVINPLL